MWDALKRHVAPLQSFRGRATQERQMVKRLKEAHR